MKNNISFPGLGLEFNINPTFSLFGFEIHYYGLLIGIGLILAVLFAMTRAKKYNITSETILDFVLIGLPSAIVGARLFYVIGDPSCLKDGILGAIAVWNGGLSIYGGLTFAVLSCMIYMKIKGIKILPALDLAAPSFMIGQIIGRWGNFVNAEVYGGETSAIWGMSINGANPVHPLFLYEGIWQLIGFIILVTYSKFNKASGRIFALYLIWYGVGRFFLEGLRDAEYVLLIFGLPFSKLLSIAVLIAGIVMLLKCKKENAECKMDA